MKKIVSILMIMVLLLSPFTSTFAATTMTTNRQVNIANPNNYGNRKVQGIINSIKGLTQDPNSIYKHQIKQLTVKINDAYTGISVDNKLVSAGEKQIYQVINDMKKNHKSLNEGLVNNFGKMINAIKDPWTKIYKHSNQINALRRDIKNITPKKEYKKIVEDYKKILIHMNGISNDLKSIANSENKVVADLERLSKGTALSPISLPQDPITTLTGITETSNK